MVAVGLNNDPLGHSQRLIISQLCAFIVFDGVQCEEYQRLGLRSGYCLHQSQTGICCHRYCHCIHLPRYVSDGNVSMPRRQSERPRRQSWTRSSRVWPRGPTKQSYGPKGLSQKQKQYYSLIQVNILSDKSSSYHEFVDSNFRFFLCLN